MRKTFVSFSFKLVVAIQKKIVCDTWIGVTDIMKHSTAYVVVNYILLEMGALVF